MKKIIILIMAIIIVILGIKVLGLNKRNTQSYKSKNIIREKDGNYKDRSNDYNEFDGKPFNKGYDGNYNKQAVENANKEHSKVTLNSQFKIIGESNVNGVNAIYDRDIDGDTLVATIDGKKETIRFASVDTAEDVNPKIKVIEPYSIQGADYVKSKLREGENIKIVTDGSKGKYGRTVGYIYYKDSNNKWYNLNLELVANGLARVAYVNHREKDSRTVKEIYRAEESARNQKINIWSIDGYVTPLGYNLAIFK